MHSQNAGCPFALFFTRVKNLFACFYLARIHSDIAQGACVLIVLDFKDKPKRVARRVTGHLHPLFFFELKGLCGADLVGGRQKVDDGVEQGLNACIFPRRSAQKRNIGLR